MSPCDQQEAAANALLANLALLILSTLLHGPMYTYWTVHRTITPGTPLLAVQYLCHLCNAFCIRTNEIRMDKPAGGVGAASVGSLGSA